MRFVRDSIKWNAWRFATPVSLVPEFLRFNQCQLGPGHTQRDALRHRVRDPLLHQYILIGVTTLRARICGCTRSLSCFERCKKKRERGRDFGVARPWHRTRFHTECRGPQGTETSSHFWQLSQLSAVAADLMERIMEIKKCQKIPN